MQQVIRFLSGMCRHKGDSGITPNHHFRLLRPLRHRVIAHDHSVLSGPRQDLCQRLAPVVAARVLPALKIGNELTHQLHAFSVHALHFLQRLFQESRVHVEAGHIGISELLTKLQRRVIHFTDSVKALHLTSVIRIDDRAAENRDSCLRQVCRHLLRLQIKVLAIHAHEFAAMSVGMRVKIDDLSVSDYILTEFSAQVPISFRGSPSFLQVMK